MTLAGRFSSKVEAAAAAARRRSLSFTRRRRQATRSARSAAATRYRKWSPNTQPRAGSPGERHWNCCALPVSTWTSRRRARSSASRFQPRPCSSTVRLQATPISSHSVIGRLAGVSRPGDPTARAGTPTGRTAPTRAATRSATARSTTRRGPPSCCEIARGCARGPRPARSPIVRAPRGPRRRRACSGRTGPAKHPPLSGRWRRRRSCHKTSILTSSSGRRAILS